MLDSHSTLQALSDIQALKQAVMRSKNKLPLTIDSVDTHLILNMTALLVSASIVVCEIAFSQISHDLIFAATTRETQMIGLGFVGTALLSLLGVVYGYLYVRARKGKVSLTDFSDKHFAYFKNMSALSDIFVKFCAFGLVMCAGRPEWIAPLFVLYIGDIVFQGRVLILSQRASLGIGLACFATALAMLAYGVASILVPAGIAVLVSAWSLVNIISFRRKLTVQE